MTAQERAPHRFIRRQGGAMAGLFWITPLTVYVGAPPSTTPSAVSLAPDGLRVVGPQAGFWPWGRVTAVTVEDVPARTTAGRSFARAFEVVFGPQSPTEMTVWVETTDGSRFNIPVHSAAASAYTVREVELSRRILETIVHGKMSPAVLTEWLVTYPRSRPPHAAEREALLRHWMENS